MSLERKEFLQI